MPSVRATETAWTLRLIYYYRCYIMRSTRSDFSCQFQRSHAENRKNEANVNEENENFSFKTNHSSNPRQPVALISDRLEHVTPRTPIQCWRGPARLAFRVRGPTLNGGSGGSDDDAALIFGHIRTDAKNSVHF